MAHHPNSSLRSSRSTSVVLVQPHQAHPGRALLPSLERYISRLLMLRRAIQCICIAVSTLLKPRFLRWGFGRETKKVNAVGASLLHQQSFGDPTLGESHTASTEGPEMDDGILYWLGGGAHHAMHQNPQCPPYGHGRFCAHSATKRLTARARSSAGQSVCCAAIAFSG